MLESIINNDHITWHRTGNVRCCYRLLFVHHNRHTTLLSMQKRFISSVINRAQDVLSVVHDAQTTRPSAVASRDNGRT
jgi:hypothetical protein